MNYLFNLIYFIVKTEGPKGLLNRLSNIVFFKLGLRRSVTIFFHINLSKDLKIHPSIRHQSFNEIEFKEFSDLNAFLACNKVPEKMEYIPVKKWFDRGSECLALVSKDRIIAYTWVHKNFYDNLGPAGVLQMSGQEVLIGPFYTDPEFRQNGFFHYLMQRSLNWLQKSNVNRVYGSSNISNTPSIKVFIKNGFLVSGLVTANKNKSQIFDFDISILLSNKIKKVPV